MASDPERVTRVARVAVDGSRTTQVDAALMAAVDLAARVAARVQARTPRHAAVGVVVHSRRGTRYRSRCVRRAGAGNGGDRQAERQNQEQGDESPNLGRGHSNTSFRVWMLSIYSNIFIGKCK